MYFDVINADCIETMRQMEANSVDSIVCDPPYMIGFMGKNFDDPKDNPAGNVETWQECLRILKPGGHLLAFAGTRTYHRLAVAVEDAGFEIRDQLQWVYGSGFPKSANVAKNIETSKGIKTEKGEYKYTRGESNGRGSAPAGEQYTDVITDEEAQQWDGWGTALKPAHEPIVMARKPLKGTVAQNVLEWGTGAVNVDGCRIATDENLNGGAYAKTGTTRSDGWGMQRAGAGEYVQPQGRHPANLILEADSEQVRQCFPVTGQGNGGKPYNYAGREYNNKHHSTFNGDKPQAPSNFNDKGSAARYFKQINWNPEDVENATRLYYCAKANKRDRNEGCEGMPMKLGPEAGGRRNTEAGKQGGYGAPRENHHPTCKPTELMRYLCRLVTPPGGTVLDPFAGSGTTGKAAIYEGFYPILIEKEHEYAEIAYARCEHAVKEMKNHTPDII